MLELEGSDIGAEEARDIADRVLRGRAYLEADRPPSLQDRIFEAIADVFRDLFGALSSTGGRGITAWIIIALFIGVIVFLLSRLSGGFGPLPIKDVMADPTIDITGDFSVDEWLRQAEEAEAAGDWRNGIRCRHRSLVTALVDRELLSAKAGQTAGEIEQAVAIARPATAEPMRAATWLFKDTWYGWVEPTSQHRDQFIGFSQQVLAHTELVDA